jgi:hypothetical protein
VNPPKLYGALCAIFLFGITLSFSQSLYLTNVSVTSNGSIRMVTQPSVSNPDLFLLESSSSPEGPWSKVADLLRTNVGGNIEFVTPRKAYDPLRYYRVGPFGPGPALPYIRFISPNSNVRPGLSVSLLGANFSPTPAGNTVTFELPNQSWTATVLQAATNYLVAMVPTNLVTTNAGSGLLYRVTVTTTNGTGNGVGCYIYPTSTDNFMLRPSVAFVMQPPGSGKDTLIIGGGVPPYNLVPQTAFELTRAVATLNGPVLTVTAVSNVNFANITVRVTDSSVVTQQASSTIVVANVPFEPTLNFSFHTLLGGTAPGFTLTAGFPSSAFLIEQTELQLQNAGIEVSRLTPGRIIGLIRLYFSSTVYGYQHLVIKEVKTGRARFDVVSMIDEGVTTVAHGELIENPPTIVMNVLNLKPGTLLPTSVNQELIFSDDIIRLPAAGQSFSVTANFNSVSTREEKYNSVKSTALLNFTTTNTVVGAPHIERVIPVHGEAGRNIRIFGTGFDPNPTNNQITFAGQDGTRVPATILLQTNNEIVVTLPQDALSGPVRITKNGLPSNDFSFNARFHPEAVILFDTFPSNTPTTLRLIHQQPVDEGETIGEVPLSKVMVTLDQGRLAVTNLALNQQVGGATNLNFYSDFKSQYLIVYKGKEVQEPQRHMFNITDSVGSSLFWARIYAMDDPDGTGVTFEVESGFLPFNAGAMWDYRFTSPIYRPPATSPGTDVAVRVETISQQWTSIPGSEMRVIRNSLETVQ